MSKMPLLRRFRRNSTQGRGCWPWHGQRNQLGYGQLRLFRNGPGCVVLAHRLAWELFRGQIPEGLLVLHKCDNPACVNPVHLFLGTHKDNSQDMIAKGRNAKRLAPHTRTRKLTADQVRAIRQDPRKAHIVAHAFGIGETTVYDIRARRRKALIPD